MRQGTNYLTMKITVLGANCSMGCMYAETTACICKCNRESHGILTQNRYIPIKCSPAAEKRCKEGNESGACQCACAGMNHGIYQHIPNFEEIKITSYV